jgi:N-acetylmuramoyl-L-alanine amidase-like protein
MPANPGQEPGTIWLADRGQGWELYSNGLRVETTYAITGEPRRYRIHDRTTGLQPTLYTRPVGILFHTSESDLWPLEPGYRKQLRRSTAGLLKYLRANQSYNYLIDRFGRVYRVVDDDSRASHAGSSVWARDDEVYLDLNAAFLGIAFESRWEGGRDLPITAAQVQAGRELTDYLRQRFAIAPEMCVTHGLASVSPRQHLIGYHLDWARGFPFAAFGLPDMYAEPTPSIVLFGFGYDERFLRDVGERWPGLTAAEDALAQSAAARGISLAELRLEGRDRYRRWVGEGRNDPPAASR